MLTLAFSEGSVLFESEWMILKCSPSRPTKDVLLEGSSIFTHLHLKFGSKNHWQVSVSCQQWTQYLLKPAFRTPSAAKFECRGFWCAMKGSPLLISKPSLMQKLAERNNCTHMNNISHPGQLLASYSVCLQTSGEIFWFLYMCLVLFFFFSTVA